MAITDRRAVIQLLRLNKTRLLVFRLRPHRRLHGAFPEVRLYFVFRLGSFAQLIRPFCLRGCCIPQWELLFGEARLLLLALVLL
jgi:hypothetical protein